VHAVYSGAQPKVPGKPGPVMAAQANAAKGWYFITCLTSQVGFLHACVGLPGSGIRCNAALSVMSAPRQPHCRFQACSLTQNRMCLHLWCHSKLHARPPLVSFKNCMLVHLCCHCSSAAITTSMPKAPCTPTKQAYSSRCLLCCRGKQALCIKHAL